MSNWLERQVWTRVAGKLARLRAPLERDDELPSWSDYLNTEPMRVARCLVPTDLSPWGFALLLDETQSR